MLETAGGDYAVVIRIKNARLLRLMRAAGFATVKDLSRACGLSLTIIHDLVNLRKAPLTATGEFRPAVHQLSDALGCLPEDMFSEAQMTAALRTNVVVLEMMERDIREMLEARDDARTPEELMIRKERDDAVLSTLRGRLSPREALIVSKRFGLGDETEQTLAEVSAHIGVGVERVRQVEKRALRKLRHPASNLEQYA